MAYPTLRRVPAPSVWNDLFNGRREFDQVFDRFLGQAASMAGPWVPAVDVRETKHAIEVVAELPGMRPEEAAATLT
jgi:HSP20 family molecular chaperone IbpA